MHETAPVVQKPEEMSEVNLKQSVDVFQQNKAEKAIQAE